MRLWTHDELHELMDGSPNLKEKSDKVHATPQTNEEDRERGKSQMMEIYAGAIDCKHVRTAQEFAHKVFACMKEGTEWDAIRAEYSAQKLCHSPLGNNYLCFCDEERVA